MSMALARRRYLPFFLGLALALAAPVAAAFEVTISARYRGGSNDKFENTTPVADFCGSWSEPCTTQSLVDLPITYAKRVALGEPREQFFIQPPSRKRLDIFHETTGESFGLDFQVRAVAQMVSASNWVLSPVYSATLEGGCSYRTIMIGRTTPFIWYYPNPPAPSPCYGVSRRATAADVITATVSEMAITYLLITPQPYRMKPGIYRGSLDLTIGPGGDFDFGDNVTELNTNVVRVNFVLDVEHLFLLSFPPGSDIAVLEPPGGWEGWLTRGRPPQRLLRDLPMQVWSTGPVSVYKLCQYSVGSRCGIRNDVRHVVPLDVAMSLPEGIRYQGQPVRRLRIPSGRESAIALEAIQPTSNRTGQLHFDVAGSDVPGMLPHAGKQYAGQVTIVFDSEL
ncbi:MAG TPA: hypothetical protein VJS90_03520 [Pseudomonas sp.]|uniref:hypothetical protein n=1 Tax=Pseudomonas sp. TaxID=306 RepID=UPI002B46ED56|nr:hypothetical protein [Pseudomonas sp.]HKS12088.1 hypothetical protein [Pseudomonas sp.]